MKTVPHPGLGFPGPVDRARRRHDGLAILPRLEGERVTDQVNDAGLPPGSGKDRADRFRKPFQPSTTRSECRHGTGSGADVFTVSFGSNVPVRSRGIARRSFDVAVSTALFDWRRVGSQDVGSALVVKELEVCG